VIVDTNRVCLAALGVGMAVLRCGTGPSQAAVPVVAPPPRCMELEAKMLECAREAAGVAELPPSVEAGLRDAAAINCRRLRSASGDHEFPARIAATCGAESCADFSACVAREVDAAGVDVAAPSSPPDGGPPLDELIGGPDEGETAEEAGGAPASDPEDASSGPCPRFFQRMLSCGAESVGGAPAPLPAEAVEALRQSEVATCAEFERAGMLDAMARAVARCADAPCADYSTCVADSMSGGLQPTRSPAELCAPFVEKMLTCAEEEAGMPFDPDRRAVAAIAFSSACADYGTLPAEAIDSAFDSCAAAPCAEYAGCVGEALEAEAEP
jgi:hypothetical protein